MTGDTANITEAFMRQRRFITVVFVDIVKSSEIIATHDPEEAQNIFELILSRQIDICTKHQGIVNQTMGDGMMCLFGVDKPTEDHAFLALCAAEAMMTDIAHLQAQHPDSALALRIGISSGDVILKPAACASYGAYMVTGDTVHVADRALKSAAANTILLSERSARLVAKYFPCRKVSSLAWSSGKTVNLYEKTLGEAPTAKENDRIAREDVLKDILALMRTEKPAPVWLYGEAGLGKTFLASQVLNSFQTNGYKAIRLCFYPQPLADQSGIEYRILRELLPDDPQAIKGIILDCDWRGIGSTEILHDCLCDSLGFAMVFSPAYMSLDVDSRARLRRRLAAHTLHRARKEHKIVLCAEDVQWANDDEIQTLADILFSQDLDMPPTIFTSRAKPPFRSTAAFRLHSIPLAPLTQAQTKKFLESLYTGIRLPPAIASRLHALSKGNAFFIKEYCELIQIAVRNGLPQDEIFQFIESEIPGEVANILNTKFTPLHPEILALAKIASIQGLRFDIGILTSMALQQKEKVLDGLMQMRALGILCHRKVNNDAVWQFSHEIMHRAIYTSITIAQRAALHAEALNHIRRLGGKESHSTMAYHSRHAGLHKLDYIYSKWAARSLAQRSQHATALRHFANARKALGKLKSGLDKPRHEVMLSFNEIGSLFIVSRYASAKTNIEEILAAKRYLPGTNVLKETLSYQGLLYWVNGSIPEAGQTYAAILETCCAQDDASLFLRESARLSHVYIDLSQYQKAFHHAQEAYTALGGMDPHAKYGLLTEMGGTLLSCLTLASTELGNHDAANVFYTRALEHLAQSTDYFTHIYVSTLLAHALILQDRFEEAHMLLVRALEYCKTVQSALLKPYILAALGITLSRLGKASEGLAYGARAIELAKKSHLQSRRPLFQLWYAESLMIDQQISAAMQTLRKAIKGAVASGEEGRLASAYLLMAECYNKQDMGKTRDYTLFYKTPLCSKKEHGIPPQGQLNGTDKDAA